MNVLAEIKFRFSKPLAELVDDPQELLAMIRPAGDPKFGDYQANCAMSLGKRLAKPPRDVASELVARVSLNDLCQNVEIAGPGFINLTLDDDWLKKRLATAIGDERLGVEKTDQPRKFVVDFSSPNVAKPMHVGHIRSTVIGDAIAKILSFVGHDVITDNHLGDWGTQFGMIIYGYKHFLDQHEYKNAPVAELGRLYKYVRRLLDYHTAVKKLPVAEELLKKQQSAAAQLKQQPETGDKKADKKTRKEVAALENKIADQIELIEELKATIEATESDPQLKQDAVTHADINTAVLLETAALHEGDETNLRLWNRVFATLP